MADSFEHFCVVGSNYFGDFWERCLASWSCSGRISTFKAQNLPVCSFVDCELSAEVNVKSRLDQNAFCDLRSGLVLNDCHPLRFFEELICVAWESRKKIVAKILGGRFLSGTITGRSPSLWRRSGKSSFWIGSMLAPSTLA